MPLNRHANLVVIIIITIVCCFAAYQTPWSQQGREWIWQQTSAGHRTFVNPNRAVGSALLEKFKPLPQEVIAGVEKFVIFVGKGRSGTTITASLMDAHPNMIVSNEYFHNTKVSWKSPKLLQLVKNKTDLFNRFYEQSWEDSRHGVTSIRRALSGHHYGVGIVSNFSWHGTYKELKVIGDKDNEEFVRFYQKDPIYFRRIIKQLSDTLQIPIHVIHAIRNPYDAIAAKCLYIPRIRGILTKTKGYNDQRCLRYSMQDYFSVERSVMRMMNDELNLKILDIHNADFVKRPIETVMKICKFLEVDCPEGYLQACKEKAYASPSKSRRLVAWSKEMVKKIDEEMQSIPFFQRYSYDSQ